MRDQCVGQCTGVAVLSREGVSLELVASRPGGEIGELSPGERGRDEHEQQQGGRVAVHRTPSAA